MKNKKKRRHYIFVIGIIILIVCAAVSLINVFVKTDRDNIDVSPLATNQILNGDIKNAMKEINADTFLVISYTNDQVVHKNEKEIEKYLKKVNLLDNVMYLDLKDYVNDVDYLKNINKSHLLCIIPCMHKTFNNNVKRADCTFLHLLRYCSDSTLRQCPQVRS